MFDLSYDPDQRLLRVVLQGFWSLADFNAYQTELTRFGASIHETGAAYDLLIDSREFMIQSTEIGEAFSRMASKIMAENQGRCAIVAGSVLNKLQATRTFPLPTVGVFFDLDEAMAWLMEGRTQAE